MAPTEAVHGVQVRGVEVDGETRCAHYGTDRDVIALRFPCCGAYYPCFECHEAVADHEPAVWPAGAADEPAVLCGRCGSELTVAAYLRCDDACPECGAAFNPGCRDHTHLYFSAELVDAVTDGE